MLVFTQKVIIIVYDKSYNGIFSLGANFPKWWTLSLTEIFLMYKSQSKQSKNPCEWNYTQSLRVYMGIWAPVIKEMLVCKSTQYSWSVWSIGVHQKYSFIRLATLYYAGHLLLATMASIAPSSDHSSYFGVSSCNCRLKCFAAYWILGIQQIRL